MVHPLAAPISALFLAACSATPQEPAADAASPGLTLSAPVVLREADGLVLDRQDWRWGDERGTAWRASVPLPGRASVVPSDGVVAFERLLPSDPGPWAAINGGFYDPEGRAMGLVLAGGNVHTPFSKGGGSGVFFMGPDGPRVVHRGAWEPGPTEALQSIDRLIDQGKSLVKRQDGPLAARSAVVVGEARLWLVALAGEDSVDALPDGAQLSATAGEGLPLGVFADYLVQSTAAREALNLDGAVSTQLAARTPEGLFHVRGQRGTINALTIRPPAAP